jgi:hypothetical protein
MSSIFTAKIFRVVQWFVAVCFAFVGSACAIVDDFAARGINYNLQAEEIKNQGILLNIVRAAYRRPMQFTDLSTVTGQASGTIGAEISLPLATIPGLVERTFSLSPSAQFSGGPNFNVSVLNTQEFYRGILAPIPLSVLTLYLRGGIPHERLFMLLLSDISYGTPTKATHRYNNVGDDEAFREFQNLLRALIKQGLDAESIDTITPVGAPLEEKDARDVQSLVKLPDGVHLRKYSIEEADPNLTPAEMAGLRRRGIRTYYRMERRTTSYRFCFDARYTKANDAIGDTGLVMSEDLLCGATANARDKAPSKSPRVSGAPGQIQTLLFKPSVGNVNGTPLATELNITTRSVQQVIYYLGEIARRQLGLSSQPPLYPRVYRARSREDDALFFRLQRGITNSEALSVSYRGNTYTVDVDPKGSDLSSQIIELVAQLLALNTAAKDLPTPNIIPVITR